LLLFAGDLRPLAVFNPGDHLCFQCSITIPAEVKSEPQQPAAAAAGEDDDVIFVSEKPGRPFDYSSIYVKQEPGATPAVPSGAGLVPAAPSSSAAAAAAAAAGRGLQFVTKAREIAQRAAQVCWFTGSCLAVLPEKYSLLPGCCRLPLAAKVQYNQQEAVLSKLLHNCIVSGMPSSVLHCLHRMVLHFTITSMSRCTACRPPPSSVRWPQGSWVAALARCSLR
jgi:hypothetical protein